MGLVFSNAYVTLSASSAASHTEGFLHIFSPSSSAEGNKSPIALTVDLPEGERGQVLVSPFVRQTDDIEDPITKRAWTFQERIVSRRIIEFSIYGVLWRCQEGRSNEEYPILRPLETTKMPPWSQIMETYSAGELSDPQDKLPALSFVAQHYQDAGDYLAGLWSHNLAQQLTWMTTYVDKAPANTLSCPFLVMGFCRLPCSSRLVKARRSRPFYHLGEMRATP